MKGTLHNKKLSNWLTNRKYECNNVSGVRFFHKYLTEYNILQLKNQILTANYNITKLKHISLKIKINILI